MIKDKSMGRKLIFLDIDGTLLPPGDMLIPESTLAALDRARANGHKLFLCTGRNHRMTEPLLRHDCFAGAVCSAMAWSARWKPGMPPLAEARWLRGGNLSTKRMVHR